MLSITSPQIALTVFERVKRRLTSKRNVEQSGVFGGGLKSGYLHQHNQVKFLLVHAGGQKVTYATILVVSMRL